MEIINFSDTKFKDIPEQDNPAFGKQECLMLCEEAKGKKIVLLHIEPVENPKENESVTQIALFWDEEIAWDMANMYAKNEPFLLDFVDAMCIQSLSPDDFEKWEEVKKILKKSRSQLKNT